MQNELNQERAKFRQEYFSVEEEKKEMIALRARMDEYERGVYGLSEAMYVLKTHFLFPFLSSRGYHAVQLSSIYITYIEQTRIQT